MTAVSKLGQSNGLGIRDDEFARLCRLLEGWTGIRLTETKRSLVSSRLAARIHELSFPDLSAYLDLLETKTTQGSAERRHAINQLTTNKTSFFRDPSHFELLDKHLRGLDVETSVSLWSAGCSSGQEPYSMAMTVARSPAATRTRILATDLCDEALATARAGAYERDATEGIPTEYFAVGFEPRGGKLLVQPRLRSLVSFARLNLVGTWPMRGPFHAVFCRNVMIYFDEPTRRRLVERFRDIVAPGGLLFVGSAEAIPAGIRGLDYVVPSVYRRSP